MACQSPTSRITYGSNRTYGSNITYADHEKGAAGYIAYVDSVVSREPNKISLRISHSGSLFVIRNVLPNVEVSGSVFSGYEAFTDRATARHVSIRVNHSGSLFRIDEVRLVSSIRHPDDAPYEATIDRSCGERLSVRVNHSGSQFIVDHVRINAVLRKREQPAGTAQG